MSSNPTEPLSSKDFLHMSDEELDNLFEDIKFEIKNRKLTGSDPETIAERVFEKEPTLKTVVPYMDSGLLVCPGVKTTGSISSHDCAFISVNKTWAWEHEDTVYDEIRDVYGSKPYKLSVSILPIVDGTQVELVESRARSSSQCRATQVTTYELKKGDLVKIGSRKLTNSSRELGHR